MRVKKPVEFPWRRRAALFSTLILGSVFAWWMRDLSRASAPAAYHWKKPAEAEEAEGFFTTRWRRANVNATLTVREGEYLYWLTPNSAEVVVGPGERTAGPPPKRATMHPLWVERGVLREVRFAGEGLTLPGPMIWSPSVVTRYANPVFDWAAKEGATYFVLVQDAEAERPRQWVARGVRPPLRLTDFSERPGNALRAGTVYELWVRREGGADQEVTAQRFLVASDASAEYRPVAPGLALFEAADGLREAPFRLGDAWLRLGELPPAWANTELARRARMALLLEYGQYPEAEKLRLLLLK